MFRLGINSCLSCLLVICCLSRGGELSAEILRLKAAAVVDSPIVRLGDVADVLNADPEQDFVTYDSLGNTGTVALPISAAIAQERGFLASGQRVAFLGIGSGLNCMMMGVEW